MSPLQREILELASQYFDGYFPLRSIDNEEAIRNVRILVYESAAHMTKYSKM